MALMLTCKVLLLLGLKYDSNACCFLPYTHLPLTEVWAKAAMNDDVPGIKSPVRSPMDIKAALANSVRVQSGGSLKQLALPKRALKLGMHQAFFA